MAGKVKDKEKKGNMSVGKHRRCGRPGYNRDMIQTDRELNAEAEKAKKLQEVKKEPVFDSVEDLFAAQRK